MDATCPHAPEHTCCCRCQVAQYFGAVLVSSLWSRSAQRVHRLTQHGASIGQYCIPAVPSLFRRLAPQVDEHWNAKIVDFNLSEILSSGRPDDEGAQATNPTWLASALQPLDFSAYMGEWQVLWSASHSPPAGSRSAGWQERNNCL